MAGRPNTQQQDPEQPTSAGQQPLLRDKPLNPNRRRETYQQVRMTGDKPYLTPQVYRKPVGYDQRASYWQEPRRVARYYHALQTLPPGAPTPAWMNTQQVKQAYDYLSQKNAGKAWYNWEPLENDDPGNELLAGIPLPPPEAMPEPERMQWYQAWDTGGKATDEDSYYPMAINEATKVFGADSLAMMPMQGDRVMVPISTMNAMTGLRQPQAQQQQPMQATGPHGLPQETWDTLPDWQKVALDVSPWVGRVVGSLSMGLAGLGMGGPAGAAAGLVGGWAMGATMEKGIDPETGKPIDGTPEGDLAKIMMILDKPAGWLEQGAGFVGQLVDNPGEVLANPDAAWQAGALAYEAFPIGSGNIFTNKFETYQLGQADPEVTELDRTAVGYFLGEARRRIVAGEAPDDVVKDMQARLGFSGQMRDTIGHMFLDPLNMLGDVENAGGAGLARLAKNAPLEEAFLSRSQIGTGVINFKRGLKGEQMLPNAGAMWANDPSDVVKLYGQKLRMLPPEEAARYGAVSRWISGLDSQGRVAKYWENPQGKKGLGKTLDVMRGETPQARASEVLAHSVDGLQQMINDEPDVAKITAKVQAIAGATPGEVVSSLDESPLPKWFKSAEAQPIPLAMRDLKPKVQELWDRWRTTRDQASIIQRVADMMEMDTNKLMSKLHQGTDADADALFRAFTQRLQKAAVGDQAAGIAPDAGAKKILDILQQDQGLSGLNGKKLKEFSGTFLGKDAAPFSAELYKGMLFHLLADGVENWAVKWFDVKPPKWYIRTGNMIKRAQGLMLLGLNPTFLINNALNNMVTLGWDGLLSFSPTKTRRNWLQKMGVKPVRLRAGANAAEIGDPRLTTDDLGGYELGRQIRKASRAGDIIQSLDDFARGADRFAIFANLSQKVEQWSSETAMVNAMRQYWDQAWIEGRGISKMPDDLSSALDAFDPGLAKRVKRAVGKGKSKTEIEKIIFKDLGKPSLSDVLTQQEKALLDHFPGLADDLDQAITKATTPEELRTAFTHARERVRDEINNQIRANAVRMTQEAANKVRIEGGQGLLDMFDLQMQERHDFWLLHFQKMEAVADEAAKYSGRTRQAIWRRATEEADRDWRAYENVEGAKWLGALEGLGIEEGNPTHVEAMNLLYGMRGNWNDYFQKRKQMMDAFYELAYGTTTQARRLELIGLIPGASAQQDSLTSQTLWKLVNEAGNADYVNSVLAEDDLQRQLDEIFAIQYAAQFPDNPNALAEATTWRDAIRNVRQRMVATMVLYRNGGVVLPGMEEWAGMLPPEMIANIQNLTKLLPPWSIDRKERERIAKEFYKTIYTPYIREMLDATHQNAPKPGKPMPQPPAPAPTAAAGGTGSTQPQQDYSFPFVDETPPAAPPEPATPTSTAKPADAPAQPETKPVTPSEISAADAVKAAETPAQQARRQAEEVARANQAGVFKTAATYGIGSATRGDQIHVLNILKQHYRVTDIDQVTPDMARQAFEDRALFKGAIDLEAQQALDRKILQHRAEVMRRNQAAMLPPPKRFTRDAFYREAQAQVGEDKADALAEVVDAIAQHWADENGKTVDDWYEQTILERGGVDGLDNLTDLFQLSPEEGTRVRFERAQATALAAFNGDDWLFQQALATPKYGQYTDEQIIALMEYQGAKDMHDWVLKHGKAFDFSDFRQFLLETHDDTFNVLDPFKTEDGWRVVYSWQAENKVRERRFDTEEKANAWAKSLREGEFLYQTAQATMETPAFRQWFGQSVLVDEVGKPLVLYHGTTGNFTTFRYPSSGEIGFHFGDADQADTRVYNMAEAQRRTGRQDVPELMMPVVLRMEHPLQLKRDPGVWTPEKIASILANPDYMDNPDFPLRAKIQNALTGDKVHDRDATIRILKDAGYDGVIYRNAIEGDNTLSYMVFEQDQIKSVFNRGTFQGDDVLQQGKKGLTRWLDNGQAVIHAFEAADVSTFVHEVAHVWLPQMGERDVRTVESWLRAEYGMDLKPGWQHGARDNVQAKELFARAFERYLAEGRAPVPSMRRVFENFKKWLLSIYGRITDSDIDVKLNDEIIGLFDRWMGSAPTKTVDQMSPEDLRFTLLRDDLTGLKNRRAYEETPRLAVQVVLDVEGLKYVNDNFGHEAGDQVIHALANAIRQTTEEGYRGSNRGDEFIMQFATRDEAEAAVAQVEKLLSEQVINANGEKYRGLGVNAGIGDNLQDADLMLNKNKEVAISQGKRANRGEKPVNLNMVESAPSPIANEGARVGDVVTFDRNGETLTATITEDHGPNYDLTGRATNGYDYPIPRDEIKQVIQKGQQQPTATPQELPTATAAPGEVVQEPAAPAETPVSTIVPSLPVTRETVIGQTFTYNGSNFVVDHDTGDHGWFAIRFPRQPEGTTQGTWHIDRLLAVINGTAENVEPARPVELAPAAPAPKAMPTGATVRRNADRQGIEIKFGSKPDSETIDRLHREGYKWSPRQKVWYKKEKPGDFDRANRLIGQGPAVSPQVASASGVTAPSVDPNHWPTWEEWTEQRGLEDDYNPAARSLYTSMIRSAVVDGDLGYDDAAKLIGSSEAARGMLMRYQEMATSIPRDRFVSDLLEEYKLPSTRDELLEIHSWLIHDAVKAGKKVDDDILRDYPDLYVAKEPPKAEPASIWDGTDTPPALWNAPSGQSSLFGEEQAGGFNLVSQKAENQTFKPPEGQQGALFGLGEYTQAPQKTQPQQAARQGDAEGFGPLFDQKPEDVESPVAKPAPEIEPNPGEVAPQGNVAEPPAASPDIAGAARAPIIVGDIFEYQGKKYKLLANGPSALGQFDLPTRKGQKPQVPLKEWATWEDFERETGQLVSDAIKRNDANEFRLAVRQMLLDYLGEDQSIDRGDIRDIWEIRDVPGYGRLSMLDSVRRMGGPDVARPLINDVWDLTHKPQPPVSSPITIQPNGTQDFITQVFNLFANGAQPFARPRDFEEFAQQVMGLDMNDENNLNLAYDALEGAFNMLARDTRRALEISGQTSTAEQIKAMAHLEANLLRARRTVAKMKLQQFSTPLSISEAASIAADVRPGDVILEPTAGTGNLVDHFYGRGDVKVLVNEIGEGRQDVLRAIGYEPTGIDALSGEWVIGPDGKRLPPLANVVITNPPWGAYSTGKYGRPVNIPVVMNDWSQRFTYLIMQRMSEGARMVGVMPTNWVYTQDRTTRAISIHRSQFLQWLEQHYYVRGIIESPPDAYIQRGTGVGSLLVVVDKTPKPNGAKAAIEAWGENAPKTWDEYAALVDNLKKGGTHERAEYDIRTGQSPVRRAVDDAINANRPATGPDAAGLADPNARAGKPEPDVDNIGKPAAGTVRSGGAAGGRASQPSLGDARHTAGSLGDLLSNRGAVLPSGRNRIGPDGRIVTEPVAGSADGGTNTPGGIGESGSGGPVRGSVGDRTGGQPAGSTGNAEQPTGETRGADAGVVEGQPAGVQPGVQPAVQEPQPAAGQPDEQLPQRPERVPGGSSGSEGSGAGRADDAEYQQHWKEQVDAVERAGAFTGYVGRSAQYLAGETPHHHPSLVVETKSLAGVAYPDLEPDYQPTAGVMDAYRRGDLSLEGQLDPVWAAVQQNDKNHMGMMVADDVGMGKSRTAAAFALDRIERGKRKVLVVTKNRDNITNLMQSEFPLIFGEGKARFTEIAGETMPNVKKGTEALPVYEEPTVYFLAASQFAEFGNAIKDLGVDAVIVDEVHTFKNVDETKIGAAWSDLHKDWAGRGTSFLYLSATPGTDLMDLKYLYGLKLWTVDGFGDWIGIITGKLTPEQAKKAQDAGKAFEEYTNTLARAVKETFGETGAVKVDGRNEIGYQISDHLFFTESSKADTGTLWAKGRYFSIKLYTGDSSTAALIGKYLKEEGDLASVGDYTRKTLVENSIDRIRADYPPPKFDQETRNTLGMRDSGDALDVLDKKGKKKFGQNRSAFESTLPPEHTEQIMRELKLSGSYMSRDISRLGVDFEPVEIHLTPEQIARQNKRIELYRDLIVSHKKFGRMNKKKKMDFGVMGDLQADAKRAMFDLRLQQALPEIDAALARGEKVVISIVSVSEADPATGGHLHKAIEGINTDLVEKVGDGEYSEPEDIPEALLKKAELLEQAEALGKLQSPIDLLRAKYGDRIGFITGQQGSLDRRATSRKFQNDSLDLVVISGAGKTGINLHDITGKRRIHLMVVDYDWSATEFKQELGRVDRTGQKSAPRVSMFHTGNAVETKFISTITNRMKGLGATSKGGAESTGTSSLNDQFELGTTYDKSALGDTWRSLSRDEKAMFLDKYFWEGDTPKTNLPETAEAIKKFTLALQTLPMQDANKFLQLWMVRRADVLKGVQGEIAQQAAMTRGEVLRRTKIGGNLELVEVRDQTGGRFAIASGVLTPYMNRLSGVMGGGDVEYVNGEFRPKQWRHWIGFQDTGSEDRISGLIIPPGKIDMVAKEFHASIRSARSPETALRDLRAGDKLPIRGVEGAEWELYVGKGGFREGKVVIGGTKMAHKNPVMNNGALFDARGMFFYVPEDKLQAFLHRFPLRDTGENLAQSMPKGETYAFGPSGQRYAFRYRVVSLDELIQSHLDTFDLNPKYPGELQPRNRDRAAYREQVQQIAQGLDERALIDTHLVDSGTPIIGNDLVVENGNGRVMAMRRSRMDYPERWKGYQDMLRGRLAEYGLSADDLAGVKDPVLVRERITDVDRVAFANEAQASQSMQLTVDELASTDAKYIVDADLAGLVVGDEQSIEGALKSPSNRDLVNAFLNKIPAGEKSAFLAPDGSLSNDGLTRLRNAMFVHVYPGEAGKRLANAFLVTQSEAISNIRAAIFDTLGSVSQSEALVKQGRRADDLSIADDLARAVDQYARLKASGQSVSDYLKQIPLLPGEDDLTPFQRKLVEYIHLNNRSRKKMRELLALYAHNVVEVQQDPAQMDMFGGARASKGEILDAAAEQITGQDAGFSRTVPPAEPPEPAIPADAAIPDDAAGTSETAGVASTGENGGVDQQPPAAQSNPAIGAPLGTADEFTEPPIEEAMLEGWMKDIEPALARAETALLDEKNRKTGMMDLDRDLDPATKKSLRKYLGQVGADMTDTKLAMMRYGESRRDFSLLNYQSRTGMDNLLGTVMPYEFWYTRSILNWMVRAISRPAILANWARLRTLQEKLNEGEESLPTRLKKKVKMAMPFLPDWMGDAVYTDPLKQAFPFEQLTRPWEKMAEQKNLELRKAETILTKMVEEEEITEDAMKKAMIQQSGPVWEQAIAQARNEMDADINNPLDFAFMASSPSLPISIGYNLMNGNKDRISQLPITRLIQANTAAMGIGGPRGVNIEAPLRKATGLPEVDRYEDYRVDRMLANLTAEGIVSADDAQRAMIDRSGPTFEMAQQRVSQMGMWQYWGAPLGADMFPEGEKELRDLKKVYDKAREKWAAGDKNALNDFYDEHPEYEARAASFREPEQRLRQYMISEVWDRYMTLPDLHRKQVREQLGRTFQDAFLDKETRSYDAINTTTLASWAQMMGATNPQKAPDAPQMNLDLAPADVAMTLQQYNQEADSRFPQYGTVLSQLDQMDPTMRQQVLDSPQMQGYYRWKNGYLASHPEIIPWVTSERSELYGLPAEVQASVYRYRYEKDQTFPGIERVQTDYFAMLDQGEAQFPGIGDLERMYYDLESGDRKKLLRQYPQLRQYWDWKDEHTGNFLLKHPELEDYWDWRKTYSAANPEAAPYILSDQTMARDMMGDGYDETVDLTAFSTELLQSLAATVYTGEELGAGAWMELDAKWEEEGQPYGDLEEWVEKAVKPVLRQ